ncbi:MAG: glycine--tRNA ligase subunit beta [Proteobacteria bacterium]|nr:glycine--tRNA ligase subunit beta [Pseudomonadota bacterium]
MSDLLLEIGTEEIPARFIEPEKEGLLKLLQDGFNNLRVSYGNIEILATPRRMAAFVYDVAEKQEESVTIKFGPPYNRAFDESGNPTKAATGFARSQGVNVEDLKKGVKDGVEFITVEKVETGRPTKDMLPGLFQDAISRIPFQKRMRWGSESFEYARPIQWLLALFGEAPIKFIVADVKSGNVTYGHRFLSKGPVGIGNPSEYIEKLKNNHIIVNEQERMDIILKGIAGIEEETGGQAIRDNSLIKEILYITEYPYPLRGSFEEVFLAIPKEVLVNVMKSHQRYIPIEDKNGNLMPYFIFFANTIPAEDKNVVKGNEKVLRARLADARFFFEEDKKVKLYDLYEKLSSIVFHVKLGTLKQKTDRVTKIARHLSAVLNFEGTAHIERATRMMKADLLTHMVGEFPELQGIMGRIYAKNQGEDDNVARAIEEHYLPSGGNGALPQSPLGALVSIADKIDSLTSFFSVGITPTGNLDPFALRRQALGIIKIAIDKKLHIPMEALIKIAYDSGDGIQKRLSFEETRDALFDFFITRFKFAMIEENHNQEFVESVLPCVAQDIYDGYVRLITLETQQSIEDFKKLMVGFKRAYNITKSLTEDLAIDTSLLEEKEEKTLFNLYESKKEAFFSSMNERKYDHSLSVLVGFKESIDNYFDKVFVMDKDEAIKNNRLALLKKIKDMFLTYGDFSKIRIE